MASDWEPKHWEPGYDPGPTAEDGPWGDCDCCGAEDMELHKVDGELVCDECYHDHYGDEIYPEYDNHEPDFADPGGRSALRAATHDNPRNLPCPNCKRENMLTPADRALGYQCDICADQAEHGGY